MWATTVVQCMWNKLNYAVSCTVSLFLLIARLLRLIVYFCFDRSYNAIMMPQQERLTRAWGKLSWSAGSRINVSILSHVLVALFLDSG